MNDEQHKQAQGYRIKKKRKELHLTQEELALRVGTSQYHLSRLERGVHSPSEKLLPSLADALGVDINYLRLRQDEERIKQDKKITDDEYKLLLYIDKKDAIKALELMNELLQKPDQ